MGKINIANINAGMDKVKSITESLSNISHAENVPIDCIKPAANNPYASNDTDESLRELAMSIQANGLINPITLNKVTNTEYQIISGERRYKAITRHLPWKSIPCTVFDHISYNAAQLKLHIANLDVREYTTSQKLQFYQETDRLLRSMKESGEFTGAIQQGVAELLGVSDRQVRKYKTIIENLSIEQQQAIIDGIISINDAYKLTRPVQTSENENLQPEEFENDQKTGTSSCFDTGDILQPVAVEPTSAEPNVVPKKFKHRDHIYFIKPDEQEPEKFSAYFKAGDSEDIRLGTLPSSYATFRQAQNALCTLAESRGYEEVIAEPEQIEEPKIGTSSGFDNNDNEPQYCEKPTHKKNQEPELQSTAKIKNPTSFKEAIALLNSLPYYPNQPCAYIEHNNDQDKIKIGTVDYFEVYDHALRVVIINNCLKSNYPVSMIGTDLFIGDDSHKQALSFLKQKQTKG